MLLALVSSDVEKYGVFAAMVAVAAGIMATVAAVALLWRGPMKGWELPEEPTIANRLVMLPSAFLIVFGFYFARPDNIMIVLAVGGVLAAVAVACGIVYSTQRVRFKRYKEVVSGNMTTKQVPILAGDKLTPWAKQTMKQRNLTDQQCLAGTPNAPYEADHVWPLDSRVRVLSRLTVLFVVTVFCGTASLAWLAYAVEVKVTGKAASDVLTPSQIPRKVTPAN